MPFFQRSSYRFSLLLSIFVVHPPALAQGPSDHSTTVNTQNRTIIPAINIDADDSLEDFSENPPGGTILKQDQLKNIVNNSPDTANLLKNQLGVSLYGAGRISSLPALNGMADDRVAANIDGVRITADCPNHMNPALSYLDPHDVAVAKIVAGITPVSMGGDSLGGTIDIERQSPVFAKKKNKILVAGQVSGFFHSNGKGLGSSGNVTVANDHLSIRYNGSWSQSRNYHAGAGGGKVHSTQYKMFSHDVTLAYKKDNHLLSLTMGQTDTPYEAFPNQYMDMTKNQSIFINGKYQGDFDWGTLEARGYWQRVTHVMNMLGDKGGHTQTTGMPMNLVSRLAGYSIKANIFLNDTNTLRVGNSFDHSGLNDWWPPLQGSMMMGPYTYHNINNGHRNRLGTFAEWESQWTPKFTTLLGVRNDVVMMNTGEISGYKGLSGMNAAERLAMNQFNAANRGKTDVNFDVTALAKWQANHYITWEGGYARKTRSPNMYERYSWGTTPMAMKMLGWFGDGNGYVGNINLKPEVGNTISTTLTVHDPKQEIWEVKIQPFYTYIHHYINVNYLGKIAGRGALKTVSALQFANHNAQIYGVNSSGSYKLWDNKNYGKGLIQGNLNWVKGTDLTNHNNLYHMMPVNGTLSLNETVGPWTGRVEVNFVNTKSLIDPLRREPKTPGYILLNLGGSYSWNMFRVDAGIDNVMNKKYYLPLGGMSLGDLIATNTVRAVPGIGRSFNVSLTASF
ncbi:TonB-dependent receptor [Commensalibacter oyaizuii]|uniref:TonB-dependent receptor plug domain-containing protein n=1 Tax=Commensalibacter oyaizuii TaxID=3043873 RepID=A0ABT6Q308_9PROT|nr:TonB-dependent receptor plug domain-containing protein [Commensalibacter sp. TBRC 16381]MDI2091405.1 TonB-dependent receptor plug domain-containing protein [Commensalibacter sp. TBRC 16381]